MAQMGLFDKNKTAHRVVLIPVEQIMPNPAQPRRNFDKESLENLAGSIEKNGLLQPILVRKITDKKYQLISGERRLRAVQSLGKASIKAIIYDATNSESAVWALIENLHRKDLSIFEEAKAISRLINIWGVSQEAAAEKLGRAQSTIANKLRLLKIPEDVRSIIEENDLTERHARALLQIEEYRTQRIAVEHIARQKLNVAQSEEYIDKLLNRKQKKPNSPYVYVVKDIRLFVNTINHAVDTMLNSGIDAQTITNENDEYLEYIVRIPKGSAVKKTYSTA